MTSHNSEMAVHHTDLDINTMHLSSFMEDYEVAGKNLTQEYPQNRDNHLLAIDIATIMSAERSRRQAHYHRYRTQFNVPREQRLTQDDHSLAQASLIDLDTRLREATPEQLLHAESLKGKGIAAELGHIDQLGSWQAGAKLDAEIRALPDSRKLQDAGFVFSETYGDKSEAKINYRLHLVSETKAVHEDAGEPVLVAVRKRAAADVTSADGRQYEIVKKSSFLINPRQLGRHYLENIENVIELSSNEATERQAPPLMDKIGHQIVEPFITHPELREVSSGVLAVSSLYLALSRRK